MATKPNGKLCSIREQIVEDTASGLTLQFEARENGMMMLRIFGDLPYGNREILFDANGEETAAGTYVGEVCRPSWLKEVI